MALLKIARMGHPVLRRPADSVRDPQAPAVQRLIADMTETMYDADGLGLAAPQVHESLRIIVFHVPATRRAAEAPDAGDTTSRPRVVPRRRRTPATRPTTRSLPGPARRARCR